MTLALAVVVFLAGLALGYFLGDRAGYEDGLDSQELTGSANL